MNFIQQPPDTLHRSPNEHLKHHIANAACSNIPVIEVIAVIATNAHSHAKHRIAPDCTTTHPPPNMRSHQITHTHTHTTLTTVPLIRSVRTIWTTIAGQSRIQTLARNTRELTRWTTNFCREKREISNSHTRPATTLTTHTHTHQITLTNNIQSII